MDHLSSQFSVSSIFSDIPLHGAERFGFTETLAVSLKGGRRMCRTE